MPSSSRDPFSCSEMQQRLNENPQKCPIFCLTTGIHASGLEQLWNKTPCFGGDFQKVTGIKRIES
jgi:hypothetical protein